jgi:Asp/Glu/hydantoin racemase
MQRGGKTVYGASIGVLMLETRFPRIPGDIGHAESFDFPMQYRVVRGATPDRAVRQDPRALVEDFIAAGRDLVDMGCDGITTTCGYLSLIQDQIKDALGVPVATSSLMQVPMVQALLPAGQKVGILTVSRPALTEAHLAAAGVAADTPVVGTEEGRAFCDGFLNDRLEIDIEACRADLLGAAQQLCTTHPEVGAIVLECTNMVPFAYDIRRATGLPVYSIESFLKWFQAGLMPRRFQSELADPRWR